MHKTYYNPETGYTGIEELARRTKRSKRDVENFLQKQEVYTVHKPAIRKFQTRRVYVDGIDQQFLADLVDMKMFRRKNKFTNYILTIIDCFSKFAWAVPIKKKREMKLRSPLKSYSKRLGGSRKNYRLTVARNLRIKRLRLYSRNWGFTFLRPKMPQKPKLSNA